MNDGMKTKKVHSKQKRKATLRALRFFVKYSLKLLTPFLMKSVLLAEAEAGT
ncbi:hypothetical protein NIES2098_50860 [Calothrix sp. NIES-2098]|nr:hypothetical protein NIES2098_50860 [Calothrix sp. NIES-2098]